MCKGRKWSLRLRHLFFCWPPPHTNGFVLVVRTSAMRMLTAQALPWLCCKCLCCLPLTYTCTGVCAHRHIHISMLAGTPFVSIWLILPSFCLQIGGQRQRGRCWGRGELRGKTAGHMMSRDLFTNPRQSRARTRGGRRASRTRSLNTITDLKRKRGSLPWQSQLEVGQINTTHADTLVYTRRLCLWFFFFLNWRSRWLEGE